MSTMDAGKIPLSLLNVPSYLRPQCNPHSRPVIVDFRYMRDDRAFGEAQLPGHAAGPVTGGADLHVVSITLKARKRQSALSAAMLKYRGTRA